MTLAELSQDIALGRMPRIEVRSFEPSLYLIFHVDGEARVPLCDPSGRPLRYTSRLKAFEPLIDAGLKQVEFVHESAYCEMIGTDQGTPADSRFSQIMQLRGAD